MSPRILSYILAAFTLLALPVGTEAGQVQPTASPFKGEYFVTRNQDAICVPYAKNLNQFRRMDFDVCHPRLSQKYPQFTRPAWVEVPFDLALVERIVKNPSRSPDDAEAWWQAWLKASETLRAEGKLKLWRAQIDFDGDGKQEIIARLDNPLTTKVWQGEKSWVATERLCPYRHGRPYMLESSNDFMQAEFNRAAPELADILHFSEGQSFAGETNRYYGIGRLTIPAYPDGDRIGASRGLLIYRLSKWGAGNVCSVNWVPTGAYRPLQRSPSPR